MSTRLKIKRRDVWKIALKTSVINIILSAIPLWAASKILNTTTSAKVSHTVGKALGNSIANNSGYIKVLANSIANSGGYIGIGLAMGLAAIGAGIAVGYVGAAVVGSVSEKPENLGKMLIFLGIAEGIAIYGFLFAIIILVKLH